MTSKNEMLIPLVGSERVPLPGAKAVGTASADEWVEVTVKLRRQKELPALEGRPKETLGLEQLRKTYGTSEQDLQNVVAYFRNTPLEVLSSDTGMRCVRLAGTVADMEHTFGVRLLHYSHERGAYRGRLGAIHIPKKLSGVIEGVFGLDNRRVVKQRAPQRMPVEIAAAKSTARPWFIPSELAAAYNFPGSDGAGQTIGVLEFGGGYFADDLAQFCKAVGVPVPNVNVISVGHTPTDQRDGAEGEVMLDVEVIASACPKANIVIYFSRFTEQGWVDALDAAIHDSQNKPGIISISWGDAEDHASWTPQAIRQINEAFKEAALLGITVCVASGDDGSDDQVGDGHAHVDFPSSSPYVLAVGGTTLKRKQSSFVETSWKDGDGLRRDHGGSTGGGVSVTFSPPAWQANVSIPSVNPGAKPGRIVPDVAAVASANTGYLVVVDGRAQVSGGTSAAAPLWAALVARINAQLPNSKRVGYLTPLLYQAAGASTIGAQGCNDIPVGDNNTAAVGGYSSHKGFDAVTGWGSPKGSDLLKLLTPLV